MKDLKMNIRFFIIILASALCCSLVVITSQISAEISMPQSKRVVGQIVPAEDLARAQIAIAIEWGKSDHGTPSMKIIHDVTDQLKLGLIVAVRDADQVRYAMIKEGIQEIFPPNFNLSFKEDGSDSHFVSAYRILVFPDQSKTPTIKETELENEGYHEIVKKILSDTQKLLPRMYQLLVNYRYKILEYPTSVTKLPVLKTEIQKDVLTVLAEVLNANSKVIALRYCPYGWAATLIIDSGNGETKKEIHIQLTFGFENDESNKGKVTGLFYNIKTFDYNPKTNPINRIEKMLIPRTQLF